MTSAAKVFAILDLFSEDRQLLNPDEINEQLGYSRATGYRYVKELVDAGFLQKVSARFYSLGPRIIELDYQLKHSDPLLLAANPEMEKLASDTGFDTVLSIYFSGAMKVMDTHRCSIQPQLKLSYGRGRSRPLFRSAAPKVLIASLPRSSLKKVYELNSEEIKAHKMGHTWDEFRSELQRIQKLGYYISLGEIDHDVGAMAVPVYNEEGDVIAALALVGNLDDIRYADTEELKNKLQITTTNISKALL